MNVKVNVSESLNHGAGHALVTIVGVGDIAQDSIKVLVKRTVNDDPVLGPSGWQPSKHFHVLPVVERAEGQVSIVLTPEQTAYISPNVGIIFEFTEPFTATAQVGWPAITQPTGRVSGRYRRRAAAENNATVISVPNENAAEEAETDGVNAPGAEAPIEPARGQPQKSKPASRGLPKAVIFSAIGALLLAAGGYFAYSSGMFDKAKPEQPAYWTSEQVRKHLQNQPSAKTSLEQAGRLIEAEKVDLAFLLLKQAASGGIAEAQRMLGEMYDPRLFSAETSPLPSANGEIAANHYRSAADQGDAAAMRNLGILMIEGQHGDAPDVAAGRDLLEKAVTAGDDEAETYLEKLK